MQEFSRDLLYIPKRETCLEAMAGGDDKVWHLPQQAGISLQLVDDSCWKIPVYSHLHSPGRTLSPKKGDPRCASKNCQVKHLLSLIPQDTVGVKGIAQISPEQLALHWGVSWNDVVGLRWVGKWWHCEDTGMKGCKEALEIALPDASGGGDEVVFP